MSDKKNQQTKPFENLPIDAILSANKVQQSLMPYIKLQSKLLKLAEKNKSFQKIAALYAEQFSTVQKLDQLYDPILIAKKIYKYIEPNKTFFLGNFSLKRFEELNRIFVQCDAIGLELSLYENIPINTFYELLKDQKPCDYKEVLKQYIKENSQIKQVSTQTISLTTLKKIFVLLGILIDVWIKLAFIFPSLSPQELKEVFESIAAEYIQQEIPECDTTVAKDIARYLAHGDQDNACDHAHHDVQPTTLINTNIYIINNTTLPQFNNEGKQRQKREAISDNGEKANQKIRVIEQKEEK